MSYGHAMTLTTPRCFRPGCDKRADAKDDRTGNLLCAPHARTVLDGRCARCGSKCLDADDCDLLLQDRLTDHMEG